MLSRVLKKEARTITSLLKKRRARVNYSDTGGYKGEVNVFLMADGDNTQFPLVSGIRTRLGLSLFVDEIVENDRKKPKES